MFFEPAGQAFLHQGHIRRSEVRVHDSGQVDGCIRKLLRNTLSEERKGGQGDTYKHASRPIAGQRSEWIYDPSQWRLGIPEVVTCDEPEPILVERFAWTAVVRWSLEKVGPGRTKLGDVLLSERGRGCTPGYRFLPC